MHPCFNLTVRLLASKRSNTHKEFQVVPASSPPTSLPKKSAFQKKYDELQDQLHVLAARDDLFTGKVKIMYAILTETCH